MSEVRSNRAHFPGSLIRGQIQSYTNSFEQLSESTYRILCINFQVVFFIFSYITVSCRLSIRTWRFEEVPNSIRINLVTKICENLAMYTIYSRIRAPYLFPYRIVLGCISNKYSHHRRQKTAQLLENNHIPRYRPYQEVNQKHQYSTIPLSQKDMQSQQLMYDITD